jgi:hypothetical protein
LWFGGKFEFLITVPEGYKINCFFLIWQKNCNFFLNLRYNFEVRFFDFICWFGYFLISILI